jgi:hypothetical protein
MFIEFCIASKLSRKRVEVYGLLEQRKRGGEKSSHECEIHKADIKKLQVPGESNSCEAQQQQPPEK